MRTIPIYEEMLLDIVSFAEFHFEEEKTIKSLARINLFVGSNSSGKSRALRRIFRERNILYSTDSIKVEEFKELGKKIQEDLTASMFQFSVINELGDLYFDNVINYSGSLNDPNRSIGLILVEKIEKMRLSVFTQWRDRENYRGASLNQNVVIDRINEVYEKYVKQVKEMARKNEIVFKRRVYIPVLRGMRPFENQENYYFKRTLSDYFNGSSLDNDLEIFTGLEMYKSLKEKLLGEPEEREIIKEYENFLSSTFFQGNQITLIPKEKDNGIVHIKIGEEKQFPIYDLGDGIQNLVILTYKIFTEEKNTLFFIEEPDLFMHPGMQRAFIEFLLTRSKHQFFITTHSNHILDMSIDYSEISIFHFQKSIESSSTKFNVALVSGDKKALLKDLGVLNSSVFLSNSTIWVEGITDRMYLRFFMKKYLDYLKDTNFSKFHEFSNYREDLHYSFVEYQGSVLVHWSFSDEDNPEKIKANFVCANAFLIADGDIMKRGDRVKDFQRMLEERFYLLPVKEIENLLPKKCIDAYVLMKDSSLITSKIKKQSYSSSEIAIGRYLDKVFKLNQVFGEKSGTIKSKRKFCDFCIENLQDYNLDLQEDSVLIDLCAKIFNHISLENKV